MELGRSASSRRPSSTRSSGQSSASGTALELVLLGFLADGHVLLEDYPGLGEDAGGAIVRAGARAWSSRGSSSRPDLLPADVTGSSICEPARRATSSSGPGRSSPTCCSPTRSTARRRRRRRRCSRRCRSARSRSRASDAPRCQPPFLVRRDRRTRSSTRARTRCPRRSSTASCCGRRSATRIREDEVEVLGAPHRARARRRHAADR